MTEYAQAGLSRLLYFTPLRYPGGKAKLAPYVKTILKANGLLDGEYVEPYAGGSAIALELLFHEYVSQIHINDVSKPLYAFWTSVLNHTDALCRLVMNTPLTVAHWDKQKRVFENPTGHGELEMGFATFFLNRTNRSGIFNGGIIGGRDQNGPWKIDARFNAKELVNRIEAIGRLRNRIKLTRQDALKFLKAGASRWPKETLVYLDPPYYVKGRDLYYDFYEHQDHQRVADFVRENLNSQQWIVSYDNVPAIRKLYKGTRHIVYDIGYSARSACQGSEIMFFNNNLKVPSLIGPITITENKTRVIRRTA
jgi:DNA adenine methylase